MSRLETVQIAPHVKKFDDRTKKPIITSWKKAEMIRNHSLLATIRQILAVRADLDVVKIGIIGEESTGKSTLAMTLAHLIHVLSPIPFAVRVFGEKEFLDFETTLKNLDPANYVLIFDDISFINNQKAISALKGQITKIRHLPGGQDVKIILIYNYHYTLGLDKYLRQSNFKYFTSAGSSEKENLIKIFGTAHTLLVEDFQKKYYEMTNKHTCTFEVKTGKYFIYQRKKPFVNCLFYDNLKPRWTLFPKREWIEPTCSVCSEAQHVLLKSEVSVDQFAKECEDKFRPGIFKQTVKIKLLLNGINVYKPSMLACMRYFDRALETKIIALEDLATHYGFETKRTKLRKKLDGVLAS